jgi:hypothetical protein
MAKKTELDPKAFEAMATSMHAIGKDAAAITAAIHAMTEAQIKFANASKDVTGHLELQGKFLKEQRDYAAQHNQLAANSSAQEQNKIAQLEKQLDILKKTTDMSDETYVALKQEYQERKNNNKAADQSAQAAQRTALALTGVGDAWKGTLIGSFFQGDFQGNMQRTIEALKDQFTVANMLGSSLMKVQEMTMLMVVAADSQFASVNQLTNGTGEYNDMILATMENNTQFNVDLETAGEAVGELYQGMSQFTEMTEESQVALVEATAQLKGLGIDASTTAANMEILNKSLAMSADQAIAVQKDFAAMASDLGVNANKIAKDFEANSDVFVAYGDQAVEVFKEVAAAAKATGIEMQALLGITTQFDTFEGAATAAGKLNAILGGGVLNSMELLNASEEERIRLLIQSIQLSGKSWESMNKFERIAVANAAGISDMTEASKLFGQSLSEYDAAQKKVEDNAAAQELLAERAAAATAMTDKLKRIMEQFAVAINPILTGIHAMLNGILWLNDATGGFLIPTLIVLMGLMFVASQRAKIMAFWEGVVAAKTTLLTWAKSLKTAATNLDTTSIFTNTAATQSNTLATIRASAATAWNTIKTQASTLATKISTFFNWGQATSQTAVGVTAAGAAPGTFVLSRGITAIGKAALRFIVPIAVLSAGLIGLGLAIAAPLILVAVIIWSLKDLTIAMLEMTDAIVPALLGLVAFIGIVALGLPVLALSIVAFFWILSLAITPIMLLQPVLPTMIGALLGIGVALWILGNAIKQFIGEDMPGAMLLAVASLWAFSISLIALAPYMLMGATTVGAPIALLGLGLLLLGKGLQEWNDVGFGAAVLALVSLWAFSYSLIALAPFMTLGAFLVGGAVLLLGFGLQALAKGIKEFNKIGMGEMIGLGVSLSIFALTLIPAGWALSIAGAGLMFGAVRVGIGLWALAQGVAPWMDMDFPKLAMLGWTLAAFAIGLGVAGWMLAKAGVGFLIGAVIVALGLVILNAPLRTFAETLAILAPIAGTMPAIAFGLFAIGMALPFFAFGIMVLGIAASLPFFKTGLKALTTALYTFADAMETISAEKAVALGQIFQGLAEFTDLKNTADVLFELASGIWAIGRALDTIPETKAMAFSVTADSLAGLIDSSVQLTPEVVTNVEGMTAAAREYADAQRSMKTPDKDAFVQALREVMGENRSASAKQGGQDIVLEVDGDEFARAVNAAIDSKHGVTGF